MNSGNTGSGHGLNKVKRKRNRVPLSCTICRKRKVKCDKVHPHCTQCTKTGVQHLCHYMEQSWAGEVEKEISREQEVKKLREKVRALEDELNRLQLSSVTSPKTVCSSGNTSRFSNATPENSVITASIAATTETGGATDLDVCRSIYDRYDNDELDLTVQFDMLHLKNKGTVHLGATHWLAVMKGDPYLRLLWSQIFTMRERLAEWYAKKLKVSLRKRALQDSHQQDHPQPKLQVGDAPPSRCPFDHTKMMPPSTAPGKSMKANVGPETTQSIKRRVCQLLPAKSIVMLYLDKFFNHLYPAIPIVNEVNFRKSIDRILVVHDSTADRVSDLDFSKNTDQCNFGMLLIIMRLVWLSLSSNSIKIDLGMTLNMYNSDINTLGCSQTRDDVILFAHEPSTESLDLVRKKLIKFDQLSSFSNSNVSLVTIQFAIFYKMYLKCCSNTNSPGTGNVSINEDNELNESSSGQDDETHQVLMSSITQMAFSCGLHRDPDNFPQLNVSPTDSSFLTQQQVYATTEKHLKPGMTINKESIKTSPGAKSPIDSTGKEDDVKERLVITEKYKHEWRKTWFYIIALDVEQSLSLGIPRLLRNLNDISDTKFPSSSKIDYVRDIKELIIVKNFTLFYQIDLVITAVLNTILNISNAKNVKKSSLDFLIQSLKSLTHNNLPINEVVRSLVEKGYLSRSEANLELNNDDSYGLPSLHEIFDKKGEHNYRDVSGEENAKKIQFHHETITKALIFSKHMTLRSLIFLMNYILFTHYEPMAAEDPDTVTLAEHYAQEALNYAMDGYLNCLFFFSSLKLSQNVHSIFNYMEVILSPHCLDVGNRGLQFIICLLLRSKCGPLTGMGDTTVMSNKDISSSSSSVGNESASDSDREKEKVSEINKEFNDFTKPIQLNMGDGLSELLYSRVMTFYTLTNQVSKKYTYATKLSRSVKFFLSLLNNTVKSSRKNNYGNFMMSNWKHPKITNFNKDFKLTTNELLSSNPDQMRRCPVFQDTLGFTDKNFSKVDSSMSASLVQSTAENSTMNRVQLPAFKAYKPVTYNNSSVRSSNPLEDPEINKRRCTPLNRHGNESPISINNLISSSSYPKDATLTPQPINYATRNHLVVPTPSSVDQLPSIGNITKSITPIYANETLTLASSAPASASSVPPIQQLSRSPGPVFEELDLYKNFEPNFNSPNSDCSPINETVPTFQDFLAQDTKFSNGLLIDVSRLCEAVGLKSNDQPNLDLVKMETPDFLPVDIQDFNSLQSNTMSDLESSKLNLFL